MARTRKLKSGNVDLIEKKKKNEERQRKKKEADKAKNPDSDGMSAAEFMTKLATEEGQKIVSEHIEPMHPLVITSLGLKIKLLGLRFTPLKRLQPWKSLDLRMPVVDPTGVWAMKTPPFFKSQRNMILHTIAREDARIYATFDIETFQLRAGVLNHGMLYRFHDDSVHYDKRNYPDVEFFSTWPEIRARFLSLAAELIEDCVKRPGAGENSAKIYAHRGQSFDWVGFALNLGIDRHTGWDEDFMAQSDEEGAAIGEMKQYKAHFTVSTHSGKSRINISIKNGKYRVLLLDSYNLLPASLEKLGGKGKTPLQYTDPIAWLKSKIRPSSVVEMAEDEPVDEHGRLLDGYERIPNTTQKGKRFDVELSDIYPYLGVAHKVDLSEFDPAKESTQYRISAKAYEALRFWKDTIEDKKYSCDDVIELANHLKRYARKFRQFTDPLRDILGDEAVNSLKPFSYNTASTAGFALSAAYWYAERLEKTENGIELKKSLRFQQKKEQYALFEASGRSTLLKDNAAFVAEIKAGTPVISHGIIPYGKRVVVKNPVWTSALDNRFSRICQQGSQTTVFKTIAHLVKEFDLNSSFPNSMANGCKKTVDFPGYVGEAVLDGHKLKFSVPAAEKPIRCNALIGFEDPGYRDSKPTAAMHQLGLVSVETMKNELGKEVKMYAVRGRAKILQMLQFRHGEFLAVLPPSTKPELFDIPGLPLRMHGSGLDSRLINAQIVEPTLLLLRGSYLAAYAAYPTLDDEAMVVFLAEVTRGEDNKAVFRDRSRHGPIMGVGVTTKGVIIGKPFMPHKRFFEMMYSTRLAEKKQSAEAKKAGDIRTATMLSADADMTKLLMNGGGYGTYAQGNRPEIDFNLESATECMDIITIMAGLDPAWQGMEAAISILAPELSLSEDEISWKSLKDAIKIYQAEHEQKLADGKSYAIKSSNQTWIRGMRHLLQEWADNHITTFAVMPYISQEVDDKGNRIVQQRGIITLSEETAPHAIRPYASEVVAKSAITLHEGQLAVHRSPFGLAYSDTDSIHVETGIIKPFNSPLIINAVIDECARIGMTMPTLVDGQVDHWGALEALMKLHGSEYDSDPLVKKILGICGLKIGVNLGEWGLEDHKFDKGLVMPILEGTKYRSEKTYYLAPKVYLDTTAGGVVARAKVRSVPKVDPLQPAVLQGHVVGIPSLADRRGLSHETLRYVRLDGARKVHVKDKHYTVNSLFSNPRRIYKDTSSSEAFALRLPAETKRRILEGALISPAQMGAVVMSSFGIGEGKCNIVGLEDAYLTYQNEARIRGMSFADAQEKVMDATQAIRDLINGIESSGIDNTNDNVFAISEEDNHNDYMNEINRLKADHEARAKAHKEATGEDYQEPFLPF